MNTAFLISVIFSENVIAVFAAIAALFLFREFARRKQRHLLFFGLLFLAFFTGYGLLFFGQILYTFERGEFAEVLIRIRQHLSVFEALLVSWALIEPSSSAGSRKRSLYIGSIVIPSISLAALLLTERRTVVVNGIAFPGLDLTQFLSIFGAFFFVSALLVAWRRLEAHGESLSPDSAGNKAHFFRAGMAGLFFGIFNAAGIIFQTTSLLLPAQVAFVCHLLCLFFAAVSAKHPDRSIAEKPVLFFRRSLLLTSTGLTVVIFWILAYALLIITSSYFVRSSLQVRQTALRRDAHFFARSYASSQALLLEETLRLARVPELFDTVKKGSIALPTQLLEFVERGGARRVFRLVDENGTVLYSSYSPQEVGTSLASSASVTAALHGVRTARTEKDRVLNTWIINAAVPVTRRDGSTVGVVLGTDAGPSFDFSAYMNISPIFASGYGFVVDGGGTVFSTGAMVDEVTKAAFGKSFINSPSTAGQMEDGSYFAGEWVMSADEKRDGFFYIFVMPDVIDEENFRILAVVTLIILLLLAAISATLVFSIAFFLRPIRELRSASGKVERDEYDVQIEYRTPDELGELAAAFNRMSKTIGDRTNTLRIALQEQKDFLAHTAHEMRTPLNVFQWTIELMRYGDTGRLTKEQLELIEQLNQTTIRLKGFVQNLLDASRLESKTLPLNRQFVSLEDVIDEAAGALSVRVREKNINLHWKRPEPPLPKVYADRERIYQAVLNLMSNASKYTQTNGHIEILVAETGEMAPGGKKGRYVQVAIEDNGRGIPRDQQDRIFSRFFRAKNVLKEDIVGTGLGLFITKQLVEQQGGAIWFTSQENVGSTFYFTIPVEKG